MVADLAIMRDMGTDHKQAAVADPSDHPSAFGPGVHRHIFTDRIIAADDELRPFAAIFEILRFEPNGGERRQACTLADRGAAVDDDVRAEGDSRAESDILADD